METNLGLWGLLDAMQREFSPIEGNLRCWSLKLELSTPSIQRPCKLRTILQITLSKVDASTSYIQNLENKSIKLEEHVIIDQYMLEITKYRNAS